MVIQDRSAMFPETFIKFALCLPNVLGVALLTLTVNRLPLQARTLSFSTRGQIESSCLASQTFHTG